MQATFYDRQIASIPEVIGAIVAQTTAPALDANRPLIFTGIGTSLHAARVAANWVCALSRGEKRAFAVDAHDLGAGAWPVTARDQIVVISHRGKKIFPTAAQLVGLAAGAHVIAVVGEAAPEQPAHATARTCPNETAGTFSVSYLASLAVLAKLVAAYVPEGSTDFLSALEALPKSVELSLQARPEELAVRKFAKAQPILITGFGDDYVTAQEAALKIKEGAWLWTEAMSPEFALHGTPAAYASHMSAIVILPTADDGGRSKLLVDVLNRLGLACVLTSGQGTDADFKFAPPPHPLLRPFVSIIPFHLLTAELARHGGTDPDTLHGHREPWKTVMMSVQL
jgi:glucosamine--fructose-6-phosphate aminotransferase (isomerizing)